MKDKFLALLIMIVISYTKNDKVIEYAPFFEFFKQNNIILDTIDKAAAKWEYGFKFKSLVDQKIKKVGIFLPAVGSFEVRIYDINLNKILLDTTITTTVRLKEFYINIPEIAIPKNGIFGLTVKADSFIKLKDNRNIDFVFPRTVGSIDILSFNEMNCNINLCNSFPSFNNTQIIAPCVNAYFEVYK